MQKLEYAQVQEAIYREQLPNGLSVYVCPKAGFNKTYATFTTRYGSIDRSFRLSGGAQQTVPDGIAHFLEHKMFEQESGEDVFQQFALQGASANAFTSFTRTAYLFSCTDHVDANLTTLLDYVQSPYFTKENVEKEKGIIGQEIRMYDDAPDWRSYFGLIGAFYREHPVRIDIAGTVESIQEITKDTLYQCYETFYHPSNMLLFVVGNVDPEQIFALVLENQAQKQFAKRAPIERFFPEESDTVAAKRNVIHLPVGIPKCLFGFKEKKAALGKMGDAALKQELMTEIVFEALFGSGSELYQSLYDQGLIDESFSYDYTLEPGFAFSMIGGDTPDPDRLLQVMEEEIPKRVAQGISMDEFERIRKKKIGYALRALNSPEFIANQFTQYEFLNSDLFQITPLLESTTLDEVNERMRESLQLEQMAASIVSAPTQARA
jgi:predicted Zn-dependent peptidase